MTTTREVKVDLCRGGPSFGCRQVVENAEAESRALGPHMPKVRYYCRLCGVYLGCNWCAQRKTELVCLRCYDWATEEALKEHGPMAKKELARQKIITLAQTLAVKKPRQATYLELKEQARQLTEMR